MKIGLKSAVGVFALLTLAVSFAVADSTEKYIKQLSDPNAGVRAKAAHELGCG